jgi:membrane associated rhomboid family serine protease
MGIGDRAYMRETRAPRNPVSVTAWVVGVLVVFFIVNLIQESAKADLLGWTILGESPPMTWQWLTHALVHEGFWHLLGNGLILWWTGSTVEREYGPRALLGVLALGTLAGAVAWMLTGLGGPRDAHLIGISAGVYALMLVALLDKLDHQITLLLFFFLPVTLRVRWLLLVTALFTLLGWAFSELPERHAWAHWKAAWQGNIAHSAHLGGLIFGWLAWRYLQRTSAGPSYAQIQEPMESKAPRPSFEAPTEVNTPERPLTRTQARAELDSLLDKISAGGFGSLTSSEKRRLEELSARLR